MMDGGDRGEEGRGEDRRSRGELDVADGMLETSAGHKNVGADAVADRVGMRFTKGKSSVVGG